jgi:hypothetical protein
MEPWVRGFTGNISAEPAEDEAVTKWWSHGNHQPRHALVWSRSWIPVSTHGPKTEKTKRRGAAVAVGWQGLACAVRALWAASASDLSEVVVVGLPCRHAV